MVFDDLLLDKQNTCESYYVRGGHSNIDCFYLAKNYFKLPRQTIRESANFICLFLQDRKNLNHIFEDHVGSDMTKEEFRQLCKIAWEKQQGFVIIDLSSKHTTVNIEVGLMSFTYQIKLETKHILYSHYKMEKLLKQIVNNREPKKSFSIVVSDIKTRFKAWFKPPIQLDKKKDYEIALINLKTYFSFPNMDRSNNCFSYSPGTTAPWFDIIIPEGSYHVDDFNELVQREMIKINTTL